VRASRTFHAGAGSIRAARRFVVDVAGELPAELREAVCLMVSELAMNVVQHAHTSFDVTVEASGGRLRVEVTDSGGGTPELQPGSRPDSVNGRGLQIIHRLAGRWGITPAPGGTGKTVWFEVAVTAQPAGAAR
jgi:anti-sigma regulatory factor (Ser/Thr protein kinase)